MNSYEDILHLSYRKSTRRSHMSVHDRAAQFSPFAALTGFDAAIAETGRYTSSRTELEEYGTALINQQLVQLKEQLARQPEITLTWFLPDSRKSGGAYQTISGQVKKIDFYKQTVLLLDGTEIAMQDILSIESAFLQNE